MQEFKFLRGYTGRLEQGIVWLPYIIRETEPVVIETNMDLRRPISARYYGAIDPATNHFQTFRVTERDGREL
jgi:hypothetical protein